MPDPKVRADQGLQLVQPAQIHSFLTRDLSLLESRRWLISVPDFALGS